MPSEVRFAEVRRQLERAGWTLDRISGSHHVFRRSGCATVSVPVHRGKVKVIYVRQIQKLIEKEGD